MKILSISIFIFIQLSTFAQYDKITEKIGWCVESGVSLGYWLEAYVNTGDTTINGTIYTKINENLIRENPQSQKVFLYNSKTNLESLLYDFNLKKDDFIFLDFNDFGQVSYTVKKVDSIDTHLGKRKQINLITEHPILDSTLTWIEGMGSTYGPIYLNNPTLAEQDSAVVRAPYSCLNCVYLETNLLAYSGACGLPCFVQDGACNLFMRIDEKKALINKQTTIYIDEYSQFQIESNSLIQSIQIYSMEGNLLHNQNINAYKVSIKNGELNNSILLVKINYLDLTSSIHKLIQIK